MSIILNYFLYVFKLLYNKIVSINEEMKFFLLNWFYFFTVLINVTSDSGSCGCNSNTCNSPGQSDHCGIKTGCPCVQDTDVNFFFEFYFLSLRTLPHNGSLISLSLDDQAIF